MKRLLLIFLLLSQPVMAQWTYLDEANGLPGNSEQITAISSIDGRLIIGTVSNGIYLSDDNGDSWRKPSDFEENRYAAGMVSVDGRLIAGYNYAVLISGDQGENWSTDSTGLGENGDAVNTTILGVVDGDVYVSNFDGLRVSGDTGDTWQSAGTGLPAGGTPQDVAGMGSTAYCTWGSGVYKTEDGSSWTRTTGSGLPDSNPQLGELVAINDTLLVYAWNTGLFMSADQGENWTRIDEMDGDDINIHDLFVHDGKVYAATGSVVYVSSDNGLTWEEVDENFPSPTNMTILGANNTTLLAGQNAAGSGQLWKYELTPTDIAYENKSLPDAFYLGQNYPNPFNPSTNIIFEIEIAQRVNLTIFNLRGQVIKTLVARQFNAGRHHINWDGTNEVGKPVPSGVYLYRLRT